MDIPTTTPVRHARRSFNILAFAAVFGAVSVGMTAPASADHGPTHVTFEITGGGLSISQPASRSLGTATTQSTSLGTTMGNITVTDERGVNLGSYTAQVVGTAFTTGSVESPYAIPAGNVTYTPPGTISGTGTAVRSPGTVGSIAQARTAMSASGVVGNNTSVWNPTITVTVPTGAVAGTYTGTITHSVA